MVNFNTYFFKINYFCSQWFEILTLRTKPIYISIEKNDYETSIITEIMER